MGEEKKHELRAIHDLAALDFRLESFPERPATRLFYEPQYFKIEHQSPLALFGYILPLEAIGPAQGKQISDRATRAHGPKCASFVRLHTDEDVSHLEKALAVVESLEATDKRYVEENLLQTVHAYKNLLEDIRSNVVKPLAAISRT
jgi:hypothetical protein